MLLFDGVLIHLLTFSYLTFDVKIALGLDALNLTPLHINYNVHPFPDHFILRVRLTPFVFPMGLQVVYHCEEEYYSDPNKQVAGFSVDFGSG